MELLAVDVCARAAMVTTLTARGGGGATATAAAESSARNGAAPTRTARSMAGCGVGVRTISGRRPGVALELSSSCSTSAAAAASGSGIRRAHGAILPVIRAVAAQDSLTSEDSEGIGDLGLGQRELKDYPPGLQRYETMAVLRPDISEEQRLALTQRYEEAIIAGGGLDVEMFNRGMQPLSYNIRVKNMSGVLNKYLDGIYLLFTYVMKPESQGGLQKKMNTDDDIIRATTFRLKV